MKVLGLCSGRKNGNTEIMMKEAFKVIEEKTDAECGIIRIQDADIDFCTGCETCMIHHIKGDWDFKCIRKPENDHFLFIEERMREADAIIVSSPAYNLLPTGITIRLLNRLHASGDYRPLVAARPKVGAAFTIGGTDWTNLALPVAVMMAAELVGSYDSIADQVNFNYLTAKDAVLLEESVFERMRLLGERVSDALLKRQAGETWSYAGDAGICPDCHNNLLEWRDGQIVCPMCNTTADVSMVDGKLVIEFTDEQRALNRWSEKGQREHLEMIGIMHGKARAGSATIREGRRPFIEYDHIIELPSLVETTAETKQKVAAIQEQ